MVECASRYRTVVRLKSGDPTVFGRLGEELDALREAGISYEVVPGVTAATAAAAAARFTFTDRRAALALGIFTGPNFNLKSLSRAVTDPSPSTSSSYLPPPG